MQPALILLFDAGTDQDAGTSQVPQLLLIRVPRRAMKAFQEPVRLRVIGPDPEVLERQAPYQVP